jgi:hypothetical protein
MRATTRAKMMRHQLATVATTALAIACGSSPMSNQTLPPPTIATTKDNVCDQVAAVACYDWYTCCSEGEIEHFLGVVQPRPEPGCVDDVKRLCERKLTTEMFSVTNARVSFDGSVMDACLKAMLVPAGGCTTVAPALPWLVACMDTAWIGVVPVGGECDFAYECAQRDANFCAPNRQCTARPTLGMPCANGCAAGLFCNNGTCATLLDIGSACTVSAQCMPGLYCDFSQSLPTCVPLHAPGEVCNSNQSCRNGDCIPGSCAGETNLCYTSANCAGRCATSGFFCQFDYNCNSNGHCSITTTATCNPFGMNCMPGDGTCVYPEKCNAGTCVGDVVCADITVSVDYCTDVLSSLPVPAP